jgi:hypothetical protein
VCRRLNEDAATPEERLHAIAEILARGVRRLLEGRQPEEPPEIVRRTKPKRQPPQPESR